MINSAQFKCEKCNKLRYPMDMHNNEICKVCWLKEYKKAFEGRIYKSWATRRKNKLLSG